VLTRHAEAVVHVSARGAAILGRVARIAFTPVSARTYVYAYSKVSVAVVLATITHIHWYIAVVAIVSYLALTGVAVDRVNT
jgi:hypothetical protein